MGDWKRIYVKDDKNYELNIVHDGTTNKILCVDYRKRKKVNKLWGHKVVIKDAVMSSYEQTFSDITIILKNCKIASSFNTDCESKYMLVEQE